MDRFKNALTRRVYEGIVIRGFHPDVIRRAVIKLTMVIAATDIKELSTPPSNHLEKLKGNRAGQWSIRVNDKYRICFEWRNHQACEIELVDYH